MRPRLNLKLGLDVIIAYDVETLEEKGRAEPLAVELGPVHSPLDVGGGNLCV